MSIHHVIRAESDVASEQPIRIPFEFSDRSALPEGETLPDHIEITPITVRTWFRLKPLLLLIDRADLEQLLVRDGDFSPEILRVMAKYDDLVLRIILLGIHNKPGDPPAWFGEVLRDNSTWEDLALLLNAVLLRLCYNPFCNTITTLANVSPMSETEIIALERNAESWNVR